MPDHTQEDWKSSEESGDEEETHVEVEDRTANVEEDQSHCPEVVGEGDEAEVMQDLLLVPQRRTMSQVRALVIHVHERSVPGWSASWCGGRSEGASRWETRGPEDGNFCCCRGCCTPRRRLEERLAPFNV